MYRGRQCESAMAAGFARQPDLLKPHLALSCESHDSCTCLPPQLLFSLQTCDYAMREFWMIRGCADATCDHLCDCIPPCVCTGAGQTCQHGPTGLRGHDSHAQRPLLVPKSACSAVPPVGWSKCWQACGGACSLRICDKMRIIPNRLVECIEACSVRGSRCAYGQALHEASSHELACCHCCITVVHWAGVALWVTVVYSLPCSGCRRSRTS